MMELWLPADAIACSLIPYNSASYLIPMKEVMPIWSLRQHYKRP